MKKTLLILSLLFSCLVEGAVEGADEGLTSSNFFQSCNGGGSYWVGGLLEIPTRNAQPKPGCPGWYECEPGYMCVDGQRVPCPSGTFSSRMASTQCALCNAGYRCEPYIDPDTNMLRGSSTPQQLPCAIVGDSHTETTSGIGRGGGAAFYCPQLSITTTTTATEPNLSSPLLEKISSEAQAFPLRVSAGYYSDPTEHSLHRTKQYLCEPGSYCVDGIKYLCVGGRYGSESGSTHPSCSGECAVGYTCPPGSTSPFGLSEDVYEGIDNAVSPSIACKDGNSDNGDDDDDEVLFLCPEGVSQRIPLGYPTDALFEPIIVSTASSSSNDAQRLKSAAKGYRIASTPKQQVLLAEEEQPIIQSEEAIQLQRRVLLAAMGQGEKSGLSGQVEQELELQQPHHLDTDAHRHLARVTIEAEYRENDATQQGSLSTAESSSTRQFGTLSSGMAILDEYSGTIVTTTREKVSSSASSSVSSASSALLSPQLVICPRGYYCTPNGQKHPCPAGRAGTKSGEINPLCDTECAAGYYCPLASTSPMQYECGGSHLYCPPGSGVPVVVSPGFFTLGGGRISTVQEDETLRLNETTTVASSPFSQSHPTYTRTHQSECPPGYYCSMGEVYACPASRYGASRGLQQSACDGLCSRGYFCPSASTSPTQIACGNSSHRSNVNSDDNVASTGADVFCPLGSAYPRKVATGFYSVREIQLPILLQKQVDFLESRGGRGLQREVIISSLFALSSDVLRDEDKAILRARYIGDTTQVPHDEHVLTYEQIRANAGGHDDDNDDDTNDDEDVYDQFPALAVNQQRNQKQTTVVAGNAQRLQRNLLQRRKKHLQKTFESLSSADEKDASAYPFSSSSSSISASQYPILDDSDITSMIRTAQLPCEPGHYCLHGKRYTCDPGYYNDEREYTGNTESTIVNVDDFTSSNNYSTLTTSSTNTTNASSSSSSGVVVLPSTCKGVCSPGYYCPRASVSSMQIPCGNPSVYCPAGSALPTPVRAGYYTVTEVHTIDPLTRERILVDAGDYIDRHKGFGNYGGIGINSVENNHASTGVLSLSSATLDREGELGSVEHGLETYVNSTVAATVKEGGRGAPDKRTTEKICPRGTYCQQGIAILCPPGVYGSTSGLILPTCSGPCEAGYYCPLGSVNQTQHKCGNETYFCPRGSGSPSRVTNGYYSVSGRTISTQGRFSLQVELTCDANYTLYWDLHAPAAARAELPAASVCREIAPTGDEQRRYLFTSPGDFVRNSLERASFNQNPEEVNLLGQSIASVSSSASPSSSSSSSFSSSSPEIVFGTSILSASLVDSIEFPPEPDSIHYHFQGRLLRQPTVPFEICSVPRSPLLAPTQVSFQRWQYCYGTELGDVETRSSQRRCEKGSFCWYGLRMECPVGYYGEREGEDDFRCTDVCPAGYFCPWGSTNGTAFECGGGGGSGDTSSSATTPIADASSSAYVLTPAAVYCPLQSGAPTPVDKGYYSDPTEHPRRRTKQFICEPGSYCIDGIKYACSSGYFGATFGLFNAECSGLCVAGYFCPKGSISPTQIECGIHRASGVYCPAGSTKPLLAPPGFYTTGGFEQILGHPDNTTRTTLLVCEPGHYCIDGVKRQCPGGTYGSTYALSSSFCSGPCFGGHFCPPASTSPYEYRCGDLYLFLVDVLAAIPAQMGIQDNPYNSSDKVPLLHPQYDYTTLYALYKQLQDATTVSSGLKGAGSTSEWQIHVKALQTNGNYEYFDPTGVLLQHHVASGGGNSTNQTIARPIRCSSSTNSSSSLLNTTETCSVMDLESEWESRLDPSQLVSHGPIHSKIFVAADDTIILQITGIGPTNWTANSTLGIWGSTGVGFGGRGAPLTTPTLTSSSTANETTLNFTISIPWRSGVRFRLPPMILPLSSFAATMRHVLQGGPAAVYCPSGALEQDSPDTGKDNSRDRDGSRSEYTGLLGVEWPLQVPLGYISYTSEAVLQVVYNTTSAANSTNNSSTNSTNTNTTTSEEEEEEPSTRATYHYTSPIVLPYPYQAEKTPPASNYTRDAIYLSPPGWYAIAGIGYQCPPGHYGANAGLTSRKCTSWCPPAHECPIGTSKPTPCQDGFYATGGNSFCIPCPSSSTTPPPTDMGALYMGQRYDTEYTRVSSNNNINSNKEKVANSVENTMDTADEDTLFDNSVSSNFFIEEQYRSQDRLYKTVPEILNAKDAEYITPRFPGDVSGKSSLPSSPQLGRCRNARSCCGLV